VKRNGVIFGVDVKSDRSQRQIGYFALVVGLIAAAGGIFGLWIQGRIMYDGTPLHTTADVLCFEDIFASIFLPSFVILIGAFLLSWAILSSKLTATISDIKRNVLFATVAVVLLTAIFVASKIAAGQDWARANAGAKKYFESKYPQTNAPASSPAKPPITP
jgi:hypothetical protein